MRRVQLLLVAVLLLVAGCTGSERVDSSAPKPRQDVELDLSANDQVEVLAAAVSEAWFRFGLQSRSAAGDVFYAVEPPVDEQVIVALRSSFGLLPRTDVVWVKALDDIPHRPDGSFKDGYAVSVRRAIASSQDAVDVEVSYHYGVDDLNASTARIERVGGAWTVVPSSATGTD